MISNDLGVRLIGPTENYSISFETTPPFLTPAWGFVETMRSSFRLEM
jgi:hypothetical protein